MAYILQNVFISKNGTDKTNTKRHKKIISIILIDFYRYLQCVLIHHHRYVLQSMS